MKIQIYSQKCGILFLNKANIEANIKILARYSTQFRNNITIFGGICEFSTSSVITDSDLPTDKTLLMTEKDWVKAKAFTRLDAWYLSVEAVLSEQLQVDFLHRIKNIIN